jgi:DJ-1 family protein
MARALVLLAEGFEEIETATIVDVLRRAEVDVTLAGLHGGNATRGSRGMVFVPDTSLDEADRDVDLLVLPGGAQGAENLAADARVRAFLRERVDAGQPVAAICAAPLALDQAGVLREGAFTCYPGWESRLETKGRRHETVVESDVVVTSQGPGTAMDFALALVARLCGRAKSLEVARGLLHATP